MRYNVLSSVAGAMGRRVQCRAHTWTGCRSYGRSSLRPLRYLC